MIRGRQGRHGFRGLTLATLCDLIWVEIWDDCSPMANLQTYREIMTRLFLRGEEPSRITYKGSDGKMHRLSEAKAGPPPKQKVDAARALYQQLIAAKQQATQASEVASSGDG